MEHYHPGAAERMLKMAETGQSAIINSNAEAMRRTQKDVRWGQLITFSGQTYLFLTIIASFAVVLYSIHMGAAPIVSVALAGWPIGKSAQELMKITRQNSKKE